MIKNGFIKVGTSSPRVSVGNPIANVEVMLKALEVAKQKQLGILVFPELSVSGYTCGDLLLQTYLVQDVNRAIELLLEKNPFYGIVVVGGPISIDRNLYNFGVVFQ